jgi:hypothetical protein
MMVYVNRSQAGSMSFTRTAQRSLRTTQGVFAVLFVFYGAWLIITLPQFGVTWDVFFEFPRATAYVNHFLGGSTDPHLSPWHRISYEQATTIRNESWNGCLPSLCAALAGRVFFEWLGMLDYIDSYHLGLTLIWIAAVGHFYFRLQELHSPRHALLASILLGLAPRIVGEVHNNMKDLPCMAFTTAGFLEMAIGVKRNRVGHLVAAGLLFGCALSSKFTAGLMILPVAVCLWLSFREPGRFPRPPWHFRLAVAAMPLLAVAVVYAHWPYLWVPPVKLWHRLGGLATVTNVRSGSGYPSIYPLAMLAITTPIPVLIGLGLAAVFTVRKASRQAIASPLWWTWWIWLLWILCVFSSGRIALFDGIRHFLLVWPPLAVLSAWGLLQGLQALDERLAGGTGAHRWLFPTAIGTILVTSTVPDLLYHPYEITYFNALVGGLPGATRIRFGPAVLEFEPRDYWGTSVRQAMRWINENLPTGAAVSFGIPSQLYPVYPLRSDLVRVAFRQHTSGRPHYVVFLNRRRWFTDLEMGAISKGRLIHHETSRGVPLAMVYRLPD